MKRCSKCKVERPRSEFYKHKRTLDGLGSWCKLCFRAQYEASRDVRIARQKERYHADVSASRAASKKFREANKEKLRDNQRWLKYGVSAEQYAEMVARQKGRCAICGDPPTRQGLCIDHCHETGVVRGLLCANCNQALGKLRDDPRIMRAAIDYVEAYQERTPPTGPPRTGQHEQDRCVGHPTPEEDSWPRL